MTFKEAVRTCFEKYFVIEGRARRSEYWYFVLFSILVSIVLSLIDTALGFRGDFQPLSMLFSLAILVPSITVAVRRLHDRDMSGWWVLLALIPLIGALILFVLFVMRGTDGQNRFGPDPLRGGDSDSDGGNYAPSSMPRTGQR